MVHVKFEDVLELAEKLTPEEQQTLVARLEKQTHQSVELTPEDLAFEQTLGLLVFDVGPWPDQLTLRRADE